MVRVNQEEATRALVVHPRLEPASVSVVVPIAVGAVDDLTPHQLARLLSHFLSNPSLDSPILDAAQWIKLVLVVWVKYGWETGPILKSIFPTLRYYYQSAAWVAILTCPFFQPLSWHIACTDSLSSWA